MEIKLEGSLMEEGIASIWVKCPRKGGRKLLVGGIYREHKLLCQDGINTTGDQQVERWEKFVCQWERAESGGAEVLVIGDTNVDMIKYNNPDQEIKPLVDLLNERVVTMGFIQLVQGPTRFWPNTADSLIDQVWVNTPLKVTQCRNITRATGDHNIISVVLEDQRRHQEAYRICKETVEECRSSRI